MAMTVSTSEAYQNSMRKLFPRGAYWDRQFDDKKSDGSLFCKAKADLLVRVKKRMSDLQKESVIQTAEETLSEWERVLTGAITFGLEPEERRAMLIFQKAGYISIQNLRSIAAMYGWTITDIRFPFRSAFFGFSRFGHDSITSPASFSVIYVYVNMGDEIALALFSENSRSACFGFSRIGHDRIISPRAASSRNLYIKLSNWDSWKQLEIMLKKSILANYIEFFIFGGDE